MGKLPLSIIPKINLRPAAILADKLAVEIVSHQVLGGNPGHIPLNFDLDIGGKNGNFFNLGKILVKRVFKGLKIGKSRWGNDIKYYGFVVVQIAQVIKALLLPCLYMVAMQV